MKLSSHPLADIALSNDKEFIAQVLKQHFPDETKWENNAKAFSVVGLLHTPENHKPYYLADSILSKLEHLKVKREDGSFNWSVFNNLKNGTYSYILSDGILIRVMIGESKEGTRLLHFIVFSVTRGHELRWVMAYADLKSGKMHEELMKYEDKGLEESLYKILCFVHLSEVEEIIVDKGRRWGTRKSGKVVNDSQSDVVVVDSRWNITSINNNAFSVRGHFAIRWVGKGRNKAKMVFINPFEKQGYTRKAKKEQLEM